jgi:hypothetical protein
MRRIWREQANRSGRLAGGFAHSGGSLDTGPPPIGPIADFDVGTPPDARLSAHVLEKIDPASGPLPDGAVTRRISA